MNKMDWSKLYSPLRLNSSNTRPGNKEIELRTSFTRDYDRIIFSSGFRRLQNKTQVFPLPGPVFVHNRLTHSLEVASVGRSLGQIAGKMIADKYSEHTGSFQEFYRYELSSVVASACLAHDIGNPPFGHSGEDAIRTYFSEIKGDVKKMIDDHLSVNQQLDFKYFEGNSNAFRVLTHNFNEKNSSYNLTVTTLASIVKYPCSSQEGFTKSSNLISTKKSGYFDSEIERFQALAQYLELMKIPGYQHTYTRHPFVFLTEAADDICYRIIDLEDAHRLGFVSLEKIKDLFLSFFEYEKGFYNIDNVANKLNSINDPNQKVQYIRALWIGLITNKLAELFMQNEELLLTGNLQLSLMELLPESYQSLLSNINEFSFSHIYNHKPVVEIEIAGFQVIGSLLNTFIQAALYPHKPKSEKVLQLLSQQFPIDKQNKNIYGNIQSVVDFISGMTDLFAVDLYKKIQGISITSL